MIISQKRTKIKTDFQNIEGGERMKKSERIKLLEEKVKRLERRVSEIEDPTCTYYNGIIRSWQELARITDKSPAVDNRRTRN